MLTSLFRTSIASRIEDLIVFFVAARRSALTMKIKQAYVLDVQEASTCTICTYVQQAVLLLKEISLQEAAT
jgi:hypothetical protein